MALKQEFEARYSEAYRVRISNPDDRNADTQNESLVALAVIDATAEFDTTVQAAYDATDARHVRVAVRLVEINLLENGGVGAEAIKTKRDIVATAVEALRKVTGRKRVTPISTSRYVHTEPENDLRPLFEDQQFDDVMPNPPGDELA